MTEKALRTLAEAKGVKAGLLINATRVALTGQAVAPGLFEVMLIATGRDRVVELIAASRGPPELGGQRRLKGQYSRPSL